MPIASPPKWGHFPLPTSAGVAHPADGRPSMSRARLSIPLTLAGIALLTLTNPAVWNGLPGLWAPTVGLGLVLAAWFGGRAAWLILAAGLLAVVQVAVAGAYFAGRVDAVAVGRTAADGLLGAAEVLAAWWTYRRLGGGARGLTDPRSAAVFVLLAPGLTALVFAAVRALLDAEWVVGWDAFPQQLMQIWLSRSLGLLAVAPPLLTAATPWLVRRGLVRPEVLTEKQSADAGLSAADRPTRGDWVEILGLSFGAGVLALLLAASQGRSLLEGWQPWVRRCCLSSGPVCARGCAAGPWRREWPPRCRSAS